MSYSAILKDIQLESFNALIAKVEAARRTLSDVLCGLAKEGEPLALARQMTTIRDDLESLKFCVTSMEVKPPAIGDIEAELQNIAFTQTFLSEALHFSEWLQTEYTAGNPDALCFMEELLTIKAEYSASNPELNKPDLPLDDFAFIPEMRQALATLDGLSDNGKPLYFDLFLFQVNTTGVKSGAISKDDSYSAFLKGHRAYIVRFAKRLVADYSLGCIEATHFIDDLIGMNDGLSCLIEDFNPASHEAYRQIAVQFLTNISNHFGYPFEEAE